MVRTHDLRDVVRVHVEHAALRQSLVHGRLASKRIHLTKDLQGRLPIRLPDGTTQHVLIPQIHRGVSIKRRLLRGCAAVPSDKRRADPAGPGGRLYFDRPVLLPPGPAEVVVEIDGTPKSRAVLLSECSEPARVVGYSAAC